MRAASLSLTLGGIAVALGGVYLLWELRSGGGPAPTAASAGPARPTPAPAPSPAPSSAGSASASAKARPTPPGAPATSKRVEISDDSGGAAPALPPVDSAERLLEANKLYDRGDYEGARQLAIKLLDEAPGNVKLLRVVVSSACILGDGDMAQRYVGQLPDLDRGQMAERCAKFEITLK